MRPFYRDIAWRVWTSLKQSTYFVEALIGVILFVAPMISSTAEQTLQRYTGITRAWVWIPLAALFAHLLLKALRDVYLEEKGQIYTAIDNASSGVSAARAALAEKRERLERLREVLNKHADGTPPEESYTTDKGIVWLHGADRLLSDSLKGTATKNFWRSCTNHEIIRSSASSLRGVAARIRVEDLKD
jgi:hypothetical protein